MMLHGMPIKTAPARNSEERLKNMSASLRDFIDMCLVTDPKIRLHPADLWAHSFGAFNCDKRLAKSSFPTLNLRCETLELPSLNINNAHGQEENGTVTEAGIEDENKQKKDDTEESAIDVINIHEIYYLWQLAGGDALGELRKCGLIVNRPAVLSLFSIVLNEGHIQGQIKERSSLYDPSIISLNLSQLSSCLDSLSSDDLYPTCEEKFSNAYQIKNDFASKISGNMWIIRKISNVSQKWVQCIKLIQTRFDSMK